MATHRSHRIRRHHGDGATPVPAAPAARRLRLPGRLLVPVRAGSLVLVGVLAGVVIAHAGSASSPRVTIAAGTAGAAAPADDPSAAPGAGSSGGSTAPGDPSATPTATTSPLPPAPAGFAATIDSLYDSMHSTAAQADVGATPQLPENSEFDSDVAALSPSDLAVLYAVTQNTPNWDTLATTYTTTNTTISKAVTAAGGPAAVAKSENSARAAHAAQVSSSAAGGKAARALPSPPTTSPSSLEGYEPDTTPAPFVAGDCPEGAPGGDYGEDSLFATQIAADALDAASGDAPSELVEAFGNVTIPDPVKIVLETLKLVAVIIHDTFDYLQSISNDCSGNNQSAEIDNIDNTTYDTYTLLTQVGQTTDEIDSNVAKLLTETEATAQQQLTLDIEAALAAPTGSVPVVADETPAAKGGFLDAQPVGVQAIVTDAMETMADTGQAVNPLASRTLIRADQALGAGQFKAAWTLFRQTYAYISD